MSRPTTELDRIGTAVELDLAARRADGSLSPYTTMWVARAGTTSTCAPPTDPTASGTAEPCAMATHESEPGAWNAMCP